MMTANYARSEIQPIFGGKFKFWENWGVVGKKMPLLWSSDYFVFTATNMPVRWT